MPKIEINTDKCKGCHLCINICPQKIISESTKLNKKGYYPAEFQNEEKCTGCTMCAIMCPDVVIEVYK